ncbi:hypothetical protein [Acinetobacter towneri]|nr:hypothetical protein [Acinetobacter towneri]
MSIHHEKSGTNIRHQAKIKHCQKVEFPDRLYDAGGLWKYTPLHN